MHGLGFNHAMSNAIVVLKNIKLSCTIIIYYTILNLAILSDPAHCRG